MVLFDDRRGNMPQIDKQEYEVLMNCHYVSEMINRIQKYELADKDETKTYESRVNLIKSLKFLSEEIDKLRDIYRKNGIKMEKL